MNINELLAPQDDPSGKMAEMVADLKFEDIPAENVEYVKKDLLDSLGCLIAGSTGPTVREAVALARDLGGTGRGRTLVFGDSMSVTMAGFVNGTMARAQDMGDTHNRGGHICEWITPTLMTGLSMDDKAITGKDFITAFVGGAEWGAREHVTVQLQYHTMLCPGECAGPRYATGALAKMMDLNKEQIWAAQGMAYGARPFSEQQKYTEGTPMVRLQHGYVCADAIKSAYLARENVPGVKGIYMSVGGLYPSVKHGEFEPLDLLVDDLGKRWVWREEVTMKPYGGCKYFHTPVYGLLSMMKEHDFTWQDIESAHFTVSTGCRCTIEPADLKWNPTTAAAAMFSNPYAVAFAAMTGDCFLDAFEQETVDARMASAEFRALMGRMSYDVDPSLPPFDDYPMTIKLKDGRTFSKVEDMLLGNVKNPMSWEQIEHKFWNCTKYSAVDLGKEKFQRVIDICKDMENVGDMHVLLEALLP